MHQVNLRSQDVGNVSPTLDVLNLVEILYDALLLNPLRHGRCAHGGSPELFEHLFAAEFISG